MVGRSCTGQITDTKNKHMPQPLSYRIYAAHSTAYRYKILRALHRSFVNMDPVLRDPLIRLAYARAYRILTDVMRDKGEPLPNAPPPDLHKHTVTV